MIVCKHCSSKNGLESRFCKSCGLEISDEDRDRARAEVDKLVAEGYAMLGQSRTEEAALVAEKVLEESPDFAEALSLLGMCHERNHDTLAALSCYERVVELRPDSALDKIKVQQLRNAVSREAVEAKKPNRAIALMGAAAAVILVGSIGGIVATFVARPASATVMQNNPPTSDGTAGAPFSNRELSAKSNPPVNNPESPTGTGNPEGVPPVGSGTTGGTSGPRISIPAGRGPGVLPDPTGQTGGNTTVGEDPGTAPVKPPVMDDLTVVRNDGQKPPGDDPLPDGGKSGTQGSYPVPGTETDDPMKGIEIKVHKGATVGGGGSQEIPSGDGGLTTLTKAAREQFMLGKWASAAAMYEKALRAGGDAGSINQRLGQCYSKLGRNSDAIAAYSRAESALQGAVNSGRASAKPALEAVRQALQNLRG